jgi:hypothetical protein
VRTLHRPTRLLALLLALLLPLAAACGDDSSDDADDGGTGTEQETSAPDDGAEEDGDTSSETTVADAGDDDADDPLAAAIEARSEELGIEDVVEDGTSVTLVMADDTDEAGVQAACAFGAEVNPGATISVDVGGEVTAC